MDRQENTPLSREERRQRTRAAILAAARELFAEHGYERTTIRAVAGEAGVDPALVMQHFGSKDRLFAAAALSSVDTDSLVQAEHDDLARVALSHLFAAFEDPDRRVSAIALLRSSLTHPAALRALRDDVMGPTQAQVARTIGGEDAKLRAAVLNASTLGVTIARYLLEDPELAKASREDLERIMGPALQAIVES